MGKSQRVMILVHPQFHPKKGRAASATEFDVWSTLRKLGHTVEVAAAEYDLRRFDRELAGFNPSIVFNLLEEFRGEGVYDFHIVTYLESLGIPYTGCNPRGLVVSRNKLWTSQIARGCGLAAPESGLARSRRQPRGFPLLVKFNREHASMGMTRENVVKDQGQLRRSLLRLQERHGGEVLIQEFIPGEEVTVSVWGNGKAEAFSPWRLKLPTAQDIATPQVKFNPAYRRRKGIRASRLRGSPAERTLQENSKRLFSLLDMNGYARFDFRLDGSGTPFLIDVNANPSLAKTEDFASSARSCGVEYPDVLRRIVELGMAYEPRQ